MAKVTMYRGIDPVDGTMSMFAVCGERIAPNGDNDAWLKPETFGRFENWASNPDKYDALRFEALQSMTVLWEADL